MQTSDNISSIRLSTYVWIFGYVRTSRAFSLPLVPDNLPSIIWSASDCWRERYTSAELVPEVTHGGEFQAKTARLFKDHRLKVTLKPGGPQVNVIQLLAAGRADFAMVHTAQQVLTAREQGIPLVVVMATFQKDPQALMSHAGVGLDSLKSLKGHSILLSKDARNSFWPWLKDKYGYRENQVRPYTFSLAPFLHDKKIMQQCYVTEESYAARNADAKINLFLLSNHGWQTYSNILVTTESMIKKHPAVVQKMVSSLVEGWYSFLDNPQPAMRVIHKRSSKQTGARMTYALHALRKFGLVDSGYARRQGIGAMNPKRWHAIYEQMQKYKLLKSKLDYRKAFDNDFMKAVPINHFKSKYGG